MNGLDKPRYAAGEVHSAVNVAILTHLKTNGPASLQSLDQVLVCIDGYANDGDFTRLRRVLLKMRQKRLVHFIKGDGFELAAFGPQPAAGEPIAPVDVVPPREVNVMHAPTWTPGPGPALRCGALDFKAVPSHGYGC